MLSNAVVMYADNNGVKDTLISCVTRHAVTPTMLTATLALEAMLQLVPWYARVPTDSNMSDSPSRFSFTKLLAMAAVRCDVDCDQVRAEIVALTEKWGEHQASTQPTWCERSITISSSDQHASAVS